MANPIFGLGVLVAVAAKKLIDGWFARQDRAKGVASYWKAFARRSTLVMETEGTGGQPRLVGRYQGLSVRVELINPGALRESEVRTRVRFELPSSLELGLQLRFDPTREGQAAGGLAAGDELLDPRLEVRAEDEEAARFLVADDGLRKALLGAGIGRRFVEIDDASVALTREGLVVSDLKALLDEGLFLARTVADAWDRPWALFALEHGLQFLPAGDERRVLKGALRGVQIEVSDRSTRSEPRTFVRALVESELPLGFKVMPRSGEWDTSVRLGDPVLDPVVDVRCGDPDAARALLAGDEMRGHLLAVLHAFPGSRIDGQQVLVRVNRRLTCDLDETLGDVVALVQALQDAARALRGAAG